MPGAPPSSGSFQQRKRTLAPSEFRLCAAYNTRTSCMKIPERPSFACRALPPFSVPLPCRGQENALRGLPFWLGERRVRKLPTCRMRDLPGKRVRACRIRSFRYPHEADQSFQLPVPAAFQITSAHLYMRYGEEELLALLETFHSTRRCPRERVQSSRRHPTLALRVPNKPQAQLGKTADMAVPDLHTLESNSREQGRRPCTEMWHAQDP